MLVGGREALCVCVWGCVCCLEGRELFREERRRESMERVSQNEREVWREMLRGSAQSGSGGETDLVGKKVRGNSLERIKMQGR